MKENNRCSTLFHLLVPDGKWQTVSVRPVWSARRCNSHFHSRRRQPLLPPPSAVSNSRPARGEKRRASAPHHPPNQGTPNAPLAWSVPPVTKPALRPRS